MLSASYQKTRVGLDALMIDSNCMRQSEDLILFGIALNFSFFFIIYLYLCLYLHHIDL